MGAVTSIIHTKSNANANPSREVRTHYGLVVGRRMIDEGDFKVDAFLGIPYAKPPIGELRFQKPQPPDPWDGVLQATKFGPRAPQTDFLWERWTYRVGKSESCLTLNVFSPAWEPRNDQPNGFAVLVFVHGGGFIIDSAAKYGDEGICRYLCRHDVVVVTIQYRLGLLGFFSTGDEVCRGNMGLWDQTLALKWVKENISAFNGDPSRVTIFGQSAGGVCVDLLSLSPHSRDLFQQVIPMAGNAECEWGLTTNENLSVVCREFAQKLGWKSENKGVQASTEMLQFLRKKSAKLFERGIFGKGGIDVRKVKLDLAPVPDGDFLPKPIHVLRREAPKKRCMVGTCSYEGLLFAAIGSCNFGMKGIDQILDTIVPEENFPNWKEVRENAKELYINKAYEKHKMAKAFLRLYSDLFMNNGTYQYSKLMTCAGHEVFLYTFDYCNPKSLGIISFRMPFKGATHCSELTYLFGRSIVCPMKLDKKDHEMLDLTTKLWTNFAKYGNPNGNNNGENMKEFTWEPATVEKPGRYLHICRKPEMLDKYEEERAKFWSEVQKNCWFSRLRESGTTTLEDGMVSAAPNPRIPCVHA